MKESDCVERFVLHTPGKPYYLQKQKDRWHTKRNIVGTFSYKSSWPFEVLIYNGEMSDVVAMLACRAAVA